MHDTVTDAEFKLRHGVKTKSWNENPRVADGILGQGKDRASICSPGGPEVVHYLSYGGSKLDGDRYWHSAGFTEFS